jgi:hypothetical protein
MNRRADAPAWTRVPALVGLIGLAACSRPKVESRGPFLSILQREGATAARGAVALPHTPRSVALALGGLPPGELPRLRQCLAESTDAAVRRAAPELFDLAGLADDAAPEPDPLRRALPDLPALTAAANVLGASWDAPGISVELGPICEAAASRCVPLFAPAVDHDGGFAPKPPLRADRGDALVRRGRALAWSLGNAALLRVPASSRTALLRSLQEAQTRPSGTIALVFGASRGTLDAAELELLRRQASRALAHLAPDAPQRPWLDALGAARAEWELPIALDAGEVLVIPRLSALARLPVFASEVELAGTFEWVARRPG